jgi:hypothetical protein
MSYLRLEMRSLDSNRRRRRRKKLLFLFCQKKKTNDDQWYLLLLFFFNDEMQHKVHLTYLRRKKKEVHFLSLSLSLSFFSRKKTTLNRQTSFVAEGKHL